MNDGKQLREHDLPVASERTFKRWGTLSQYLALLLSDQPDDVFSLSKLYNGMRTMYLNGHIENYSESAVRGVLWRFRRDGLITVRKKRGRHRTPFYQVTPKGVQILSQARRFFSSEGSLDEGVLAQLPRTSSRESEVTIDSGSELVDLVTSEWDEYFDWNDAWFEGGSLTFTIDKYIAEKVHKACETQARKRSAGSHGESGFTLNIWPTTARIRLWPKHPTVEKDLGTWLVKECHLGYSDLRLFYASFRRAAGKTKIIVEVPTKIDLPTGLSYFFRVGIRKGPWLGPIQRESTQVRNRSMVRHEQSSRLHKPLWSNSNRNLAKVLRVQREPRRDSRRGYGPSSGLGGSNDCPGETELEIVGITETFHERTTAAGGIC